MRTYLLVLCFFLFLALITSLQVAARKRKERTRPSIEDLTRHVGITSPYSMEETRQNDLAECLPLVRVGLQNVIRSLTFEIQLLRRPNWETYCVPDMEMRSLIKQKRHAIAQLDSILKVLDQQVAVLESDDINDALR